MSRRIAILMVNGGTDPPQGRWLALSLDRIARHTRHPDTHLFIWNNNVHDAEIPALVARYPNTTLSQADPTELLEHRHAVPLQRLYEHARAAGFDTIGTLDSDAFPIRDGWLETLAAALDAGAAIAGIWRDEEAGGITPYVHPSGLLTTVEFIESRDLRLDRVVTEAERRADTLAGFTYRAVEEGLEIHPLRRSNRNELHRVMGGIYGDLLYHHGAGSRPGAQFWDEPRDLWINHRNLQIRAIAAELIFRHPEQTLAWYRGERDLEPVAVAGTPQSVRRLERALGGEIAPQLHDPSALDDLVAAHPGDLSLVGVVDGGGAPIEAALRALHTRRGFPLVDLAAPDRDASIVALALRLGRTPSLVGLEPLDPIAESGDDPLASNLLEWARLVAAEPAPGWREKARFHYYSVVRRVPRPIRRLGRRLLRRAHHGLRSRAR